MATFTGGGIPSALQVATLQNYVSSTNFHSGLSIHEPDVSEDFVKDTEVKVSQDSLK